MLILYQWIFAHLLADFVFQTTSLVEHKKKLKAKSWFLYVHSLLHGVLIYVFLPDKNLLVIPATVAVSHFFIDLWKLNSKNTITLFVIDQLLHLLVIFTLWMVYYQPAGSMQLMLEKIKADTDAWIIIIGYLIIIYPLTYILGYPNSKWRNEVERDGSLSSTSLSEAEKLVGIFERILVFTFVITLHFEGIGFLIVAKSIMCFTGIKEYFSVKRTEYILIVTLMSFTTAIIAGLMANLLMR